MAQATIFVVDDDDEILACMEQIITNAGHRAETFTGGRNAIEKMRTAPPDMVFLDLQMSGINGFQTLKAMRQINALDDVPVVLLSALSAVTGSEYSPETIEARYGVRPNAFVSKPVLTDAVNAQLKAFLKS